MTNITFMRAVTLSAFVVAAAARGSAQPAPPVAPTEPPPPPPAPPTFVVAPLAPLPPLPVSFDVAVMAAPSPQAPQPAPMPHVSVDSQRNQTNATADDLYAQARDLIERNRYDAALDRLNRLTSQSDGKDAAAGIAARADAAMYWTAYVQARLQQSDAALETLASLQKRFGSSRWIKDAKALEVEVRQASGQSVSPESQSDEELKLLALRGLMQSDPDRALPVIEGMLNGSGSAKVKENALFVLSQSRSPRAREILVNVAKGGSNPDLQLRAVRYLGVMNGADNVRLLDEIYKSNADVAVKRAVVQALFISNAAPQLVAMARAEKDPSMKKDIVSKLSLMKSKEATDYLVELLK
jgi:hypothetical protein